MKRLLIAIQEMKMKKQNIKELMGLLSTNFFIYTPKDEMRTRTKVDHIKKKYKERQ